MKLLILADDLTGALDTGVQFAEAGISTLVLLDADGSLDTDAEAVAINLAARHMTPDDAYTVALAALKRFDAPFIYIKTDSALRGNISAIFAAALHARGGALCFAPAFPQAGRYVKNGVHYIGDLRLEDSVFRDDPMNPMRTSRLDEILSGSRDFPVRLVAENGVSGVHADFNGAFVFDCASLENMRRIAAILKEKNMLGLTAGCAGFATVLPEYIDLNRSPCEKPIARGPMLCISGSANEIGLAQIKAAADSGVRLLFLDPYDVLTKSGAEKYAAEILETLESGQSVIAATARNASDKPLYREAGRNIGISEDEMHRRISSYTANLTRLCVDKWNAGGFVLVGGDAAHAILGGMGIKSVLALGEVEPGVAVSTALYKGLPRVIITKSGAIGSLQAYINICEYLKQ